MHSRLYLKTSRSVPYVLWQPYNKYLYSFQFLTLAIIKNEFSVPTMEKCFWAIVLL